MDVVSTSGAFLSRRPQRQPVRPAVHFGTATEQTPYQGTQGPLVLELLCEQGDAVVDALEAGRSGALPALIWASPYRDTYANSRKMDVDCPNPDGGKLWLHSAKTGDHPLATRRLMRGGADIMSKDSAGQDALSIMAKRHHNKAMSVMLDELSSKTRRKRACFAPRFDPLRRPVKKQLPWKTSDVLNAQDKRGETALMKSVAAENRLGTFLMTQYPFQDQLNQNGQTALMQALLQGDTYAGLRLLRQRPETDFQDASGKTALMHWIDQEGAAKSWQPKTGYWGEQAVLSLWSRKPEFQVLTEKLVDASRQSLHIQDEAGNTALHYLLRSPNLETPTGLKAFEMMLKASGNLNLANLKDQQGVTPLMLFARHPFQNEETQTRLTRLILARPLQVNTKDNAGKTALNHALEGGNLAFAYHLIALKGVEQREADFLSAEEQQQNLNPNVQDWQGYTPLMRLSELKPEQWEPSVWDALSHYYTRPAREELPEGVHPFESIVTALVRLGAKVKTMNQQGDTALTIAAGHGNMPVIRTLVKQPGVIDDWDRRGRTALQVAALHNQPQALKELALAGANVNHHDITGKTAFQLARGAGHQAVVKQLKQLNGQRDRMGRLIQVDLDLG